MAERSEPGPKDERQLASIKVEKSVNLKALAAVIALVLAVVFVLQNGTKVTTTFLFWDVTTRQWVGILVALALGALMGLTAEGVWRKARAERKRQKAA
jgi:uncharacterized integral membrane protein